MENLLKLVPYPESVSLAEGTANASLPVTQRESNEYGEEGYRLTITPTEIIVEGKETGWFYAGVTLSQLKLQFGEELPCLEIIDRPRLSYRGFMLDSVRHFPSLLEVKKIIDVISFFKMNRLHWHLTDDQGWRIEIKKYPLLTQVGGKRERADYGKVYEPEESEGFYTQDEIREVVAYAKERCVEVIPEIEIPGHETAMLAAYPEWGCDDGTGPVKVGTRGGIYDNLICAGKEEAFAAVKDILDEVCELFPFPYLHVGGDEAVKARWRKCPHCQETMKKHGLKDENALQQWMVIRTKDYLKTKGKTAVCWNDTLRGSTLDTDFLVQYWTADHAAVADYCHRGGDIIMTEMDSFYLDHPYALKDVGKILSTSPYPPFIAKEDREHVIGMECPLWTERIVDLDRASFLMLPRVPALAEVAWTNGESREKADTNKTFCERYPNVAQYTHTLGMWEAPEEYWWIKEPLKSYDLERYEDSMKSAGNLKACAHDEIQEQEEHALYGNPWEQ